MMTAKENFLELLKPDGQPERQLRQYEALYMCLNDPANTYLRGNRKRGTVSVDRWGTTISFPEDAPGPMPVTEDGLAVCPDVTCWRETVHAPDLAAHCADGWEACRPQARAACGEERLLAGFMGTGIFEQCHFLMGFEDTLTGLYEHPQEMHDLIEYITEYRLAYVKLLIDGLQPGRDLLPRRLGHQGRPVHEARDVAGVLQGALPPVLRLHPLPGLHRHPPRRLLSGPHRGGYGGDRHSGVAGRAAGERHPRPAAPSARKAGADGRHGRGYRPGGHVPGGDTRLRGTGAGGLLSAGTLHPLHHLRPAGGGVPPCGCLHRRDHRRLQRRAPWPRFDVPPVPRRVLARPAAGAAAEKTADAGEGVLGRLAAALQRERAGRRCWP